MRLATLVIPLLMLVLWIGALIIFYDFFQIPGAEHGGALNTEGGPAIDPDPDPDSDFAPAPIPVVFGSPVR